MQHLNYRQLTSEFYERLLVFNLPLSKRSIDSKIQKNCNGERAPTESLSFDNF